MTEEPSHAREPARDGFSARPQLARRLRRRWVIGSSISLVWLGYSAYPALTEPGTTVWQLAGALALLAVYAIATFISAPLAWRLPSRWRFLPALGLFALSFSLWPALGLLVYPCWVIVGVAVGMSLLSNRTTLLGILVLCALVSVFQVLSGERGQALFLVPALVASLAAMMAGFSRQIVTINELRATRHELARLAVADERMRVARDIHDILGHSLTSITVKAELAGMLIDAGQTAHAATEVAEVEKLARGALSDVRSTVSGYRGTSMVAELVQARSILDSAGIAAELPATADALAPSLRPVAGWVIREGVTNVVRHSRASLCRISVTSTSVEVADNGRGLVQAQARDNAHPGVHAGVVRGNGLSGLAERAAAAGGSLRLGTSDLGGVSLRLTALDERLPE